MMLYSFPSSLVYINENCNWVDKSVIFLFFLTGLECMFSSVIWHTYAQIYTLTLRSRFACIDYTGITVLITGSILTTEHIALKDYPIPRYTFMTFSSLIGIFGIFLTWSPFFDKPESRPIRILFFISLAFLGVSAFFVLAFYETITVAFQFYSPLFRSFIWYAGGVVFYGALIPERWRSDVIVDDFEITDDLVMQLDESGSLQEYLDKQPETTKHSKKFWSLYWVDYYLNSHNIWHVFVLLGVLGHYSAIMEMYANRLMT
ncbi:unnamed protein product [Ambrosiozyma monospora]|uniref:Unnamed protein product n=1 Tax=Ambrosiozyma monospora TaxID=43982 RepID=A0A9W7DNX5_AMBMO|nr:unnamed protein product [Ambrosiozyma monospora]